MNAETGIQKSEPQQLAPTGGDWSRERIDLIKKTICPQGISDAEFALFAQQCKVRGLDPFAGEAFCVKRRTNIAPKGQPDKWVDLHVLQTSVAGMRARAERHGDLLAISGAAIFEKDVCLIDLDAGTVAHRYDAAKQRGAFMGAWAVVKRQGLAPIVIHLLPGSRRADGPVYGNNPSEHLRKCAMAAALREAYPTAFAGLYSGEEMPEEREPNKVTAALSGTVTVEAAAAPALPSGPVVEFGEWKHRPIAGLSVEEAFAAVAFADEKLASAKPKATWVAALKANREAIAAYADATFIRAIPEMLEAPKVNVGAMVSVEHWVPSPEEKAAILEGEPNAG